MSAAEANRNFFHRKQQNLVFLHFLESSFVANLTIKFNIKTLNESTLVKF